MSTVYLIPSPPLPFQDRKNHLSWHNYTKYFGVWSAKLNILPAPTTCAEIESSSNNGVG